MRTAATCSKGSYDEWLLEERERLRRSCLEALERLARLLEERDELARAVPYAERLLRDDPLRRGGQVLR
jgi:DNA-binding SARP family transcriptional activator